MCEFQADVICECSPSSPAEANLFPFSLVSSFGLSQVFSAAIRLCRVHYCLFHFFVVHPGQTENRTCWLFCLGQLCHMRFLAFIDVQLGHIRSCSHLHPIYLVSPIFFSNGQNGTAESQCNGGFMDILSSAPFLVVSSFNLYELFGHTVIHPSQHVMILFLD